MADLLLSTHLSIKSLPTTIGAMFATFLPLAAINNPSPVSSRTNPTLPRNVTHTNRRMSYRCRGPWTQSDVLWVLLYLNVAATSLAAHPEQPRQRHSGLRGALHMGLAAQLLGRLVSTSGGLYREQLM